MQLFYSTDIDGSYGTLPDTEARHCLRALRMRTGDTLQVTDGCGRCYTAVLLDQQDKRCPFSIRSVEEMPEPFPFQLHMAVAPTKNPDRFEWFVEKAVEIGVTEISCLHCDHSERFTVKAERMERLMVSAMKQSLHFRLPQFHPEITATDFIRQQQAGSQRFIAWCGSDVDTLPLKQACQPGGRIVVMIGPEGDFSPEEVRLAKTCGFQTVSLGNSRLRTETAAIVACSIIHCIHM